MTYYQQFPTRELRLHQVHYGGSNKQERWRGFGLINCYRNSSSAIDINCESMVPAGSSVKQCRHLDTHSYSPVKPVNFNRKPLER